MPVDIKNQNLKNTESEADLGIFLPREVTEEKMNEIRDKFYNALGAGLPNPVDIFVLMYDYFKENNFSLPVITKFGDTFWPLFVKVAWEIMPQLKENVFVDVAARTLSFAAAQYIGVKQKLLYYLALKELPEAQALYAKLKEKILAVDYPISFNEIGSKINLSQVIKKFNPIVKEGDLSRFEMLANIQKAFFAGETAVDSPEIKRGETAQVKEFVDVLDLLIKDADLQVYINDYYLADKDNEYIEPDEASKVLIGANLVAEGAAMDRSKEESPTKAPTKAVEKKKSEIAKEESFAEKLVKHKNDFSEWTKNTETLRQLLGWLGSFRQKSEARKELKNLLARELGAEALNDMEIAQAVAQLDEFLNKNNYSGADMIYFDEQSGEFKWHLNT